MILSGSGAQLRMLLIGAAVTIATPAPAHSQTDPSMLPEGEWGYHGMESGIIGGDGYGIGPGMMERGYGYGRDLGLTDDQVARIDQIRDEARQTHRSLMGAMMDEHAKPHDLYAAHKRDGAAINAVYNALAKLQRQMIESSSDTLKRLDVFLTQAQQDKLHSYARPAN